MNGLLLHTPTEDELARLYYELAQLGATSVGRKTKWPYRPCSHEELVALAAEMLRYDPRLLSILLQFIVSAWDSLNPVTLRKFMQRMRWPQALLVVMEFAKSASRNPELRYFADYLAAGFLHVDPVERFFIDAERPGSRMAARALGRNLRAYARWGFVSTEKPIANPVTKRTVGGYDAQTRKRILSELATNAASFSLADYLAAVDHSISRQQALLDLRDFSNLVTTGHGRGAKWRLRKPRRTSMPDAETG